MIAEAVVLAVAMTALFVFEQMPLLLTGQSTFAEVVGEVDRECRSTGQGETCSYNADVRFHTLEGEVVDVRMDVGGVYPIGTRVEIRYLPSNPTVVSRGLFSPGLIPLIVFGPVLLASLAGVAVWRVRRA